MLIDVSYPRLMRMSGSKNIVPQKTVPLHTWKMYSRRRLCCLKKLMIPFMCPLRGGVLGISVSEFSLLLKLHTDRTIVAQMHRRTAGKAIM